MEAVPIMTIYRPQINRPCVTKGFAHADLKLVDDVERTSATDQALPEFPKSELLEILGRSKPKRC